MALRKTVALLQIVSERLSASGDKVLNVHATNGGQARKLFRDGVVELDSERPHPTLPSRLTATSF
jgi:hypothetical protein